MSAPLSKVRPTNQESTPPPSPKAKSRKTICIVASFFVAAGTALSFLYYPRVTCTFDSELFLTELSTPGSFHVELPSGEVILNTKVPIIIENNSPLLDIKADVNAKLFYPDPTSVELGTGQGKVDVKASSTETVEFSVTEIAQPSGELLSVAASILDDCGDCLLPWGSCDGNIVFYLVVVVLLEGTVGSIIGTIEIDDALEVSCDEILN
ncbi:hypothetical protein TrRE_jg2549 [Triparma retinervis]|uniref:Uncharacterized protein n=1 Tax=Triparma retinervis TaxID=2557542 RepID=A0A9W7DUM4_9STRA|nr:hypothetical protein TrRE_jg2549 [Triparma retinervis]